MRIIHARIYTMEAAGVIPDGYLDVQDGRIAAVGA